MLKRSLLGALLLAGTCQAALAETASLSGMAVTGANAVAPEVRKNLGIKSISIKDYGAVCDDQSHPLADYFSTLAEAQAAYPAATSLSQYIDGLAINKALDEARAVSAGGKQAVKLIADQGHCHVNVDLNATMLRGTAIELVGNGNMIKVFSTAESPVDVAFDALCSQRPKFTHLTIYSPNAETAPRVGFQFGRCKPAMDASGLGSSDSQTFYHTTVFGHYKLTSVLNVAAEQVTMVHPFFQNQYLDPDPSIKSYAYIADGLNHWNVKSKYVEVTIPVETTSSMTENTIIGGEMRSATRNPAIWSSATTGQRYIGTYALSTGTAEVPASHVVELYSKDTGSNNHMFRFEGHIENVHVNHAFLLTGPNTNPRLPGFAYHDGTPFSKLAIFKLDTGIEKARMYGASVKFRTLWTPDITLFAEPEKWSVSGEFLLPLAKTWNQPAEFLGGSVSFAESGSLHPTVPRGGPFVLLNRNDRVENTGISTDWVALASARVHKLMPHDTIRLTLMFDSTRGAGTNTVSFAVALASQNCTVLAVCSGIGIDFLNVTISTGEANSLRCTVELRVRSATNVQVYFPQTASCGNGQSVFHVQEISSIELGEAEPVDPPPPFDPNAGRFIIVKCRTTTVITDRCSSEGRTVQVIPGTA